MRRSCVVGLVLCLSLACENRINESKLEWKNVPVGSAYELRTMTRLRGEGAREMVSTSRQVLLAKSADTAQVLLDIQRPDGSRTKTELQMPLTRELADTDAPGLMRKTERERCALPMGEFDCTKTTLEFRQGQAHRVSVTWTAEGVPLPLRTRVENESMVSTTELVAMTRASE
jgi:hypothetical protein